MFDYKSFLFSVLDLFKSVALDNTSKIIAEVAGYLADGEERITALRNAYQKDGDSAFIKTMLTDETNILISQANSLAVAGGQISQDLINQIGSMIEAFIRKVNN